MLPVPTASSGAWANGRPGRSSREIPSLVDLERSSRIRLPEGSNRGQGIGLFLRVDDDLVVDVATRRQLTPTTTHPAPMPITHPPDHSRGVVTFARNPNVSSVADETKGRGTRQWQARSEPAADVNS